MDPTFCASTSTLTSITNTIFTSQGAFTHYIVNHKFLIDHLNDHVVDAMPKVRKPLPSEVGGTCPNPHCTSQYFPSLKKLRMHLGAKPDCLKYLAAQRSDELWTQKLHDNKSLIPFLTSALSTITQNNLQPPPIDNATNEVVDVNQTHTDNVAQDYEECNFQMLNNEEMEDFIIDPEPTMHTNARRVETVLLKILTEWKPP